VLRAEAAADTETNNQESRMSVRFVVVTAHAWMNETGHGISYSVPTGVCWSDPKAAISEGFEICKSDDFNIAKVSRGRVVALHWMDDDIGEDAATLEQLTTLVKAAQ
jgi:hypothetical protein